MLSVTQLTLTRHWRTGMQPLRGQRRQKQSPRGCGTSFGGQQQSTSMKRCVFCPSWPFWGALDKFEGRFCSSFVAGPFAGSRVWLLRSSKSRGNAGVAVCPSRCACSSSSVCFASMQERLLTRLSAALQDAARLRESVRARLSALERQAEAQAAVEEPLAEERLAMQRAVAQVSPGRERLSRAEQSQCLSKLLALRLPLPRLASAGPRS